MNTKKEISASLEDYLETIYLFSKENQEARAGQIALHLGVKKSSVTEALQNLSKESLINYKPYSPITLTAKGKKTAEKILNKHNTLKSFFKEVLALSEEDASNTACKIEHIISDDVAEKFEKLLFSLSEQEKENNFLTKLHNSI